MRKRLSTIMAIAATLSMIFIAGPAMAADNDAQTATYAVTAINEIAITGDVTLTVSTATAGQAPDQATDSTSTYAITTNCAAGAKKITAALDGAPVTGLTFGIHVTSPSTGTDVAAAELVAGTPRDVVTAIGAVNEATIAIEYTLDATVAAGVVTSTTKTVTLTIADQV